MKTSWFKVAGALSIAFASVSVTACGAGDLDSFDGSQDSAYEGDEALSMDESMDESVELGSLEQGIMSCTNPDGTNSAMAALAVAVAQELKRWQPTKDFVMFNTSGQSEASSGMQQAIKLTSGSDASGAKGKSRCADGKCAKVQALLDMQYEQANNKVYFQGSGSTKTLLSPAALRSRLVAKLYEQKACDDSPRDNDATACPKEEHVLTFQSAAKGSCDTNFFFKATKTNGAALQYPNQLKNKLKFADLNNPYIAFQNLGNGIVSVDPTYGLNDDGSTTTGSCTAACTKISTTSVAGACCSCGGVSKKFAKAAWSAVTYVCQ
jgi:hypothetical protein